MQLIDGKTLSKKVQNFVHAEVEILKTEKNIVPGLAVVIVGDDPASHAYVSMKEKACKAVGFYSITHKMPNTISQDEIIEIIIMMNNNPHIHGILVQLPLPKHIDTNKILEVIDPKKDVDGFHAYNVGRMVTNLDSFVSCTPLGVMKMFEEYDISLEGKDIVVVGASNIVGKPMASLLINANATVTVAHIYTKDLARHTREADIVIVGVGVPHLIQADMIKEGAVVIDIGINRLDDGSLVGDVDFDAVRPKCSYITPVPGGAGPMTIAMLLENTLKSAKQFGERS
ncbi:bifunctional methylenetetrahydrofolate dehydrogenase/methenyltetrahydrofolate cyclohydrolase FolD [Sulfurovum sp. bin170]|uniref:bifunctional methylenetetrahydrofolate dehydrogenase/methenyltetrahydrofolate cyclohydrolase FolD n=1 Tax=Sulfurovum sp. bin170 TaxID=2695268 RepID=UPI0013DEE64D|nr:bifunctional methylenetetrahydrofolate dehydrogenase/methenyltetrahydrofolate cyclohydrolase FolD [Sulfurovum sp. bin170]NEW59871.1 bifunctional methylenetetrahydrofolate dehydrogenase/methenyltetrahydrofolate cyclohydrolase FolD [Sulfurovum sp. bin170]